MKHEQCSYGKWNMNKIEMNETWTMFIRKMKHEQDWNEWNKQYWYRQWNMNKNDWFWLVGFIVFSATFNNISVISWRSVLLVEENGGPGENYQPMSQVTDKCYHIMVYTLPSSVVIGTDCICNCRSNYYAITATTAPWTRLKWMKQTMLIPEMKHEQDWNEWNTNNDETMNE